MHDPLSPAPSPTAATEANADAGTSRSPAPPRRARTAALLVLPAALALLAGLAGGLLRAGLAPGGVLEGAGALLGSRAIVGHATLMIGGFLGTLIGLERAVALRHPLAFATPLASGAGVLALLAGFGTAAAVLMLVAATAFVATNIVLVWREPAIHTGVLLAAAACWAAGAWRTLSLALAPSDGFGIALDLAAGPVAAGLAFLVLTIAAERLEMTRLMRRPPFVQALFLVASGLVLTGAALVLALSDSTGGSLVLGTGLVALGAWLLAFDIARRTISAPGLARYMAACLLAGHAWLVAAGLAWIAQAQGAPVRDIALHATGLGFVMSMVMGHAPVVLPALTGLRLRFSRTFWLGPAMLHASLLARLAAPGLGDAWRADGAVGNAVAIAAFAATVILSIDRRSASDARPRGAPPAT